MTVSEKDAQILQHIVKHCDRILDTISYFGEDRSFFIENHIYQIKGQRNIIAHGYDTGVDFSKVWDMITEDIPPLRKYCADILKENNYEIICVASIPRK